MEYLSIRSVSYFSGDKNKKKEVSALMTRKYIGKFFLK